MDGYHIFELHTERLKIITLDLEALRLKITDSSELERRLCLKITKTLPPEGHLKEAYECMLKGVIENKENYLWYTNWEIVLRKENRIIGGICFKGYPNQNGEVEIGYGIESEYQCKGYTTEAVKALVKWAFECVNTKQIVAETGFYWITDRIATTCGK